MNDYFLRNTLGERMAIRVLIDAPGKGVLILLDREERGGPFVVTRDKKFPIVSLRQPPELCGIDESVYDQANRDTWIIPYRETFIASLKAAVAESGITTLLLASGGVEWTQSPYATHFPELTIEVTSFDL